MSRTKKLFRSLQTLVLTIPVITAAMIAISPAPAAAADSLQYWIGNDGEYCKDPCEYSFCCTTPTDPQPVQ
jgi:hypothetical protein